MHWQPLAYFVPLALLIDGAVRYLGWWIGTNQF
jgi:hypothetical protein